MWMKQRIEGCQDRSVWGSVVSAYPQGIRSLVILVKKYTYRSQVEVLDRLQIRTFAVVNDVSRRHRRQTKNHESQHVYFFTD